MSIAFINLSTTVKNRVTIYMKLSLSLKILTIALLIASCSENKVNIDISDSDLDLKFNRLESDLFRNEKENLSYEDYLSLNEKYGHFFKLFVENVIAVGRAEDSTTVYYLNHFRNDLQVKEIAGTTLQKYPDVELLNKDFTYAFSRYNKLFPERIIPNLYTFISAFSYTIVVDDSLLGIGLDMYLGSDQEYYRLLGIPAYKVQNMNRENIVSDVMKSWLMTEFELKSENSDLLSNMIYHGKLLYALDLLLPNTEDSIKIGYSREQMSWVRENEKDIFFHFAEKELFYSKEGKQIQKYIGEAPFTPGFPEGSPGMTGRWMGWQIVRKYMENNDPTDLQALFNEADAQKILKLSKYKPS